MSQKKKEAKINTAYHGQTELRRGPWTIEEDSLLIHYIASHGEGRWNLLARCSGLKRTGKSCRLRWLNYLKPDVKRGNLSPEEQFMILDLHSKWGNRWSRIAQYLPGRTDNEIKNYWRTRVQKQARQLKIDTSSAMFQDAVRTYWMPRLLEKMASTKISAVELPFSSKHTAQTTQPAHFNPPLLPQHHFHQVNPMIYSAELVQNAPGAFNIGPSTNVNVVTDVIGKMNNGYGDDSLGLASCSTGVSDSSSSELVDHLGSDVWMDELLSLDDLWHFRKQDEWCGLVL